MTIALVQGGRTVTHRGIVPVQTAFLQIVRDYAGLPDARELTLGEIFFYYNGLRSELEQRTKPQG